MPGSDPDDSFDLNCFLLGDKNDTKCSIRIATSMKVTELIPEIKQAYNKLATGRTLSTFALYQVDTTIEELKKLVAPPDDSRALTLIDKLEEYWSGSKHINKQHVQILIKADVQEITESLSPEIQKLASRQDTTAERFRNAYSASFAARHEEFIEQQAQDNTSIYNGRPFGRSGLSIELFHPVFETFTTRIQGAEMLSASQYSATENLMFDSQELYDSDVRRWAVMEDRISAAIQYPVEEDGTFDNESGGVVVLTNSDLDYKPYGAFIQVSNEIGADVDPSVKGSQSYARCWSQEQMASLRRATPCPSLIISIAGPWICVSGAVYLDRVVVQPLMDFVWMGRRPQQDRHTMRVARILDAITTTMAALEKYYTPFVQPNSSLSVDHNRFFPYIRSVDTTDGLVNFTYKRRLGNPEVVRPVFEATTDDGRRIVVKFSEFYNFEAHKLLAEHSFAPKLLSRDAVLVGGQLLMVVMEFSGTSLDNYLGKASCSLIADQVQADVEQAVELLHANDFVFGDLRPPNVLVTDAQRGQLVDFEWCGIHNQGRYPIGMNQSPSLWWAPGMRKGAVMRKVHDNYMVERLFL